MTALHDSKVLVLRLPEQTGNYKYWMAEMPSNEAREWREKLEHNASSLQRFDIDQTFGNPLTLMEIMKRLDARDFQVLDYPAAH